MAAFSNLKGARVLIVEDHWHVAKALQSLLRGQGADVSGPAATAADAQRLAVEQRPDLALVDINLKGEMAYALIDQLHEQGVRVVVVSGYAVLPRLTDRVAAVLQKPFNGPELVSVLRRVLSSDVADQVPTQRQSELGSVGFRGIARRP